MIGDRGFHSRSLFGGSTISPPAISCGRDVPRAMKRCVCDSQLKTAVLDLHHERVLVVESRCKPGVSFLRCGSASSRSFTTALAATPVLDELTAAALPSWGAELESRAREGSQKGLTIAPVSGQQAVAHISSSQPEVERSGIEEQDASDTVSVAQYTLFQTSAYVLLILNTRYCIKTTGVVYPSKHKRRDHIYRYGSPRPQAGPPPRGRGSSGIISSISSSNNSSTTTSSSRSGGGASAFDDAGFQAHDVHLLRG